MSVRTKMPHIEAKTRENHTHSFVEESLDWDKTYKKLYKDLPEWAVNLRGLRARENLSQEELAGRLKMNQSNISKMERGIRPIGKIVAKKLAKFFGTDYRLFL